MGGAIAARHIRMGTVIGAGRLRVSVVIVTRSVSEASCGQDLGDILVHWPAASALPLTEGRGWSAVVFSKAVSVGWGRGIVTRSVSEAV